MDWQDICGDKYMSFGFSVSGKAFAVHKNIEAAFDKAAENCKSMPHEYESILIAKTIAMKQLEFYKSIPALNGVVVNCSGHASLYPDRGDSTFTLEIKPIYGFVE